MLQQNEAVMGKTENSLTKEWEWCERNDIKMLGYLMRYIMKTFQLQIVRHSGREKMLQVGKKKKLNSAV